MYYVSCRIRCYCWLQLFIKLSFRDVTVTPLCYYHIVLFIIVAQIISFLSLPIQLFCPFLSLSCAFITVITVVRIISPRRYIIHAKMLHYKMFYHNMVHPNTLHPKMGYPKMLHLKIVYHNIIHPQSLYHEMLHLKMPNLSFPIGFSTVSFCAQFVF